MAIGKVHSLKKLTAQLVLLAVPTAVLIFYLLWRLNLFYSILENHWIRQGVYFFAACAAAFVFYAYRFRFITTAGVLLLVQYLIYTSIGSVSAGEFDSFYFSIQFLIFSILFYSGWLARGASG